MDKAKQIDLIQRRNAEMESQLKDLRFQLDYKDQLNMEGYKQAKELIEELEGIRDEWEKSLKEIEKYRIQYALLIDDLNTIKKIMKSAGFKIPWYKKAIRKIKQKFQKESPEINKKENNETKDKS